MRQDGMYLIVQIQVALVMSCGNLPIEESFDLNRKDKSDLEGDCVRNDLACSPREQKIVSFRTLFQVLLKGY
jgi:hypothetical protein